MKLAFTKTSEKHLNKIKSNKVLKAKVYELFEVLEENPFKYPPAYEKLTGDLEGKYSRRINIKHRLVYEVDEDKKIVKILSLWSHYEF